jgi:hypothetical protein
MRMPRRGGSIAKHAETRVRCLNGYTYCEWQGVEAEEAGYGETQTGKEFDDL